MKMKEDNSEEMKRCQYETHIINYLELPNDISEDTFLQSLSFGTLVDLLCAFDQLSKEQIEIIKKDKNNLSISSRNDFLNFK